MNESLRFLSALFGFFIFLNVATAQKDSSLNRGAWRIYTTQTVIGSHSAHPFNQWNPTEIGLEYDWLIRHRVRIGTGLRGAYRRYSLHHPFSSRGRFWIPVPRLSANGYLAMRAHANLPWWGEVVIGAMMANSIRAIDSIVVGNGYTFDYETQIFPTLQLGLRYQPDNTRSFARIALRLVGNPYEQKIYPRLESSWGFQLGGEKRSGNPRLVVGTGLQVPSVYSNPGWQTWLRIPLSSKTRNWYPSLRLGRGPIGTRADLSLEPGLVWADPNIHLEGGIGVMTSDWELNNRAEARVSPFARLGASFFVPGRKVGVHISGIRYASGFGDLQRGDFVCLLGPVWRAGVPQPDPGMDQTKRWQVLTGLGMIKTPRGEDGILGTTVRMERVFALRDYYRMVPGLELGYALWHTGRPGFLDAEERYLAVANLSHVWGRSPLKVETGTELQFSPSWNRRYPEIPLQLVAGVRWYAPQDAVVLRLAASFLPSIDRDRILGLNFLHTPARIQLQVGKDIGQ